MNTFSNKANTLIDEIIGDIKNIAFDGEAKTRKMSGQYCGNQIFVIYFEYGYNEMEVVHFLPSNDGNVSEVRILDITANSKKLSYWIGSFLKKRSIESTMKDDLYKGEQNGIEQSYTTHIITNITTQGERYQRLRNRIFNIARIKNCPIQSFGTEKIGNRIVQHAFPDGVYSELICLNTPNPLGHGDVYLILDTNKELIAVHFDSPDSSFCSEMLETQRVYGEKYKTIRNVTLEGDFYIF